MTSSLPCLPFSSLSLPLSLSPLPPLSFLFLPHLRNLGYWPTMYMIFEAMIALLSLPLFCSHRPSSSLITVTKKRFSSSSCMAPLMEPMAQHNCKRKCRKRERGRERENMWVRTLYVQCNVDSHTLHSESVMIPNLHVSWSCTVYYRQGGLGIQLTNSHFIQKSCMDRLHTHMYTHCIEVLPRPLCAIHLLIQLVCHNVLRVSVVQVGKVYWEKGNTWLCVTMISLSLSLSLYQYMHV